MQGSGERRREIAKLYLNGPKLHLNGPLYLNGPMSLPTASAEFGTIRRTAALASELRLRLMIDA